jgi:hypothetical protein
MREKAYGIELNGGNPGESNLREMGFNGLIA